MFAFHELMDKVRIGVNRIGDSIEAHFSLTSTVLESVERIETKVDFLMAREQVSWDLYQNNVGAVVAGYKALQSENNALRNEIDAQSKTIQDRITKAVDAALAEDDEHDAARIDAANNALPIIEHGAPIPPRPADSTPQTTEDGSHDVIGDDGQPVTVPADKGSDGDADGSTADPAGSDPAVSDGDDSGQTATDTGDHSSANADQSTDAAN